MKLNANKLIYKNYICEKYSILLNAVKCSCIIGIICIQFKLIIMKKLSYWTYWIVIIS